MRCVICRRYIVRELVFTTTKAGIAVQARARICPVDCKPNPTAHDARYRANIEA
jgi:hypothetical protein